MDLSKSVPCPILPSIEFPVPQPNPTMSQSSRRILSLDGGGLRGVFTLQVLAKIEQLLREGRKKPGLVLADEFDLIAGTSTGAIIATLLAWGLAVRDIEKLYIEQSEGMFAQAALLERWKNKYTPANITAFFRKFFSEDGEGLVPSTLGTKKLKTLILLVMRNASTGSAWPVTNNPDAMFNDPKLTNCNLQVPLWQLVRASTAAPTFFPPERITFGEDPFWFLDGGITPYNNPALIAFLTATLPGYRLNWKTGVDHLRIISVGTGNSRVRLAAEKAANFNLLDAAKYVIPALIHSVSADQDLLCRALGHCEFGAPIDMEVGDLIGESDGLGPRADRKFSYVRYDHRFTKDEEDEMRLVGRSDSIGMDNLLIVRPLIKFGKKYAEIVRPEHLGLPVS
jgi:uncharacterized protein